MARSHCAIVMLSTLLGLGACATGQDSALSDFPGGGDGGQVSGAVFGEQVLLEGAPHLLAASGTALLPGARRPVQALAASPPTALLVAPGLPSRSALDAASPLRGPADARLLPGASALLSRPAPLRAGATLAGPQGEGPLAATATVEVAAPALAPIVTPGAGLAPAAPVGRDVALGVNAAVPHPLGLGASASLLGAGATATLGAVPPHGASLTVGGGATPQTAATRLVAAATGLVNGAGASGPAAPVTAPVVGGVPNAMQLGAVVRRLPRPPGF